MIGAHGDTYFQAHHQTVKTGRPLVVLVGAEWCPACKVMKDTVIPAVKKRGGLNRVSFASVDIDEERDLGRSLLGGGRIPQLLMYRKTPTGWLMKRIVGSQSVKSVETFVTKGVELDKTDKSVAEQKSESQEEPSLVVQKRPASVAATQ